MARSFNGSSDKIALPSGFAPGITGTAFSVAVWVNPAANNGSAGNKQRTILCSNNNLAYNFQLGTNTGTPSVLELDKTNTTLLGTSSGTVADGTWTHVGVSYDRVSGALKFYINGALSGTATTTSTSASTLYTIGTNVTSAAFFYAGSMADMFVTNTLLPLSTFAALASGRRPSELGLLYTGASGPVWLNMAMDGLSSPEPDYSGNSYNGTLTGTTLAAGPPVAMITPRWPQGIVSGAAASAVVFRRSLSALGTRTGTRQVQL